MMTKATLNPHFTFIHVETQKHTFMGMARVGVCHE